MFLSARFRRAAERIQKFVEGWRLKAMFARKIHMNLTLQFAKVVIKKGAKFLACCIQYRRGAFANKSVMYLESIETNRKNRVFYSNEVETGKWNPSFHEDLVYIP
jgi:hypothetical protein